MSDNVENKSLILDVFEDYNEDQCININGGTNIYIEPIEKVCNFVISLFDNKSK